MGEAQQITACGCLPDWAHGIHQAGCGSVIAKAERDAFLAGMDAGWALGSLGAPAGWLDNFMADLAIEWGFTEPFTPSHPIWEQIKRTRAWAARVKVIGKLQ